MEGIKKRMTDLRDSIDTVEEIVLETERKVKDAHARKDEAENEVTMLKNRKSMLIDEIEKVQQKLDTALEKLASIEEAANESEVARKDLESREVNDDDTLVILEASLKDATIYAEERTDMYQDAERKLQQAEAELRKVLEKAEDAERRVAELEEEYEVHNTQVLQLENQDYHINDKEEEMEEKIKFLEEQVNEEEKRLEHATRQVNKTELLIIDTMDKCEEQRINLAEVEQKKRAMIDELSEF